MNTQRRNKTRPTLSQPKGCYNCSQRRIDCDRTLPRCSKCSKKGLTCTGYGLRIRFKHDLPAQTKKRRHSSNPPSSHKSSELPVSCADQLVLVAPVSWEPYISSPADGNETLTSPFSKHSLDHPIRPNETDEIYSNSFGPMWPELSGGNCVKIDARQSKNDYSLQTATRTSPSFSFSAIPPLYQFPTQDWETTGFLNHFSDHIAKTMITFDSRQNGYRSLLLPLAHSDTTLRDALVAASAHHLAFKCPAFAQKAEQSKARAIQGVVERSRKLGSNKELDLALMATLIVLMVDDMIVGSGDFAQLYRMLGSLLALAGGEDCVNGTDIGDFLLRQINMLRLCTSPFIQENEALSTQRERFQRCVEFINAETTYSSERDITFIKATLVTCYFQASRLYSNRVTSCEDSHSDVIRELRQSVELLEPGSAGEHVLVWVYFMAAAESSTPSDRSFFLERLKQCHTRTGFGNILRAYDLLSEIWARNGKGWTSLLTKEPKVLIM